MRVAVLVLASAVAVAACGARPSDRADSVVDTSPGTAAPGTTEPATAAVAPTTVPGERPDPEGEATRRVSVDTDRLSIADALLPDDALGPPWELRSREIDRTGYPPGPNQTTCDDYWTLESLLGREGGHAMWWRDGGNANHHVSRVGDETEAAELLFSVARIPDSCPVVKWIEGGSFTTELIMLERGVGLRFDSRDTDELTVVIVTAHADLLSVLQMPLWAAADGEVPEPSRDELAALAGAMLDRLEAAGPADIPVIEPVIEPAPTVPARPGATTAPPPTTTPPTGLGRLLLTADDLPDRWRLTSLEPYVADGSEDVLGDVCPAAASIARIDAVLTWEANFRTDLDDDAFELIGELESPGVAIEAVEEFGRIVECDLTGLMPDATWSGGVEDVPSADRAARLTAQASVGGDDLRFDLVLLAVDSVVIVVSYEGSPAETALVLDLAERAAAKAAAG